MQGIIGGGEPVLSAQDQDLGEQGVGDLARAGYVVGLVSLVTGVSAADIYANDRRDARTSRARQLAMYLAYVAWQWPLCRIGAVFGRDRTTVGHACRRIEDMRDNRDMDATVEWLESCLHDLPGPLSLKAVRQAGWQVS